MKKLFLMVSCLLCCSVASAGTVADFAALGHVDVGDKTFTYVDSSPNIAGTMLSVSNVVPQIFTLTLGDGSSNILGSGITGPGSLIYTVHINDPNFTFALATLDTTFLGATTEVDEFITPSGPVIELKSLNGSATLSLLDGQTIRVDDEIAISPLSAIVSMQNSFIQKQVVVPEVTSAVLWGMGMVGLCLLSRRRKVLDLTR